ncbi:MAG: hypothetical protein RLZ67_12 [Actinomycetota bacterium]|jgi:hypothetical protein
MRLIVGVPRRNWLPRPVRSALTMCAGFRPGRKVLFGEVAGETDANNDGENALNRCVQRADDAI